MGGRIRTKQKRRRDHAVLALTLTTIALCFLPSRTEHLYLEQTQQFEELFEETENLLKLEEDLFQEIMYRVKRGDRAPAREAAERYIRDFPLGKYSYEVYRVYRSEIDQDEK